MLASLRFVQGAVARKDLLPALTHFRIEKGTVRGYNGVLALCSRIPLDIQCNPKAEPMVRAIGLCEDTVQMSLTPAGRLSVKSGSFKAFVDCVGGNTPHVDPEGEEISIDASSLLAALKSVWPFIGDDASRPWSNGVLLRGGSAFATNNVCLVEYHAGIPFPRDVNLPRSAVKEMLRINEEPIGAQVTSGSITFHYSNSRWLRTQLFSTKWPDLSIILDKPSDPNPICEQLFPSLLKLRPFADKMGRIFLGDGFLATHEDPGTGARVELAELQWPGIYNVEMLLTLKDMVSSIDWSLYPAPCLFFGDRIRGAIVGLRG